MSYLNLYRSVRNDRLKAENPKQAEEIQKQYDEAENRRLENLLRIEQIKREQADQS